MEQVASLGSFSMWSFLELILALQCSVSLYLERRSAFSHSNKEKG